MNEKRDTNQIPDQEMELFHKPFIRLSGALEVGKEAEFAIRVGRIPHPMESSHYIEWIEIYENGKLVDRVDFDPFLDKEAKTFFSTSWRDDLVIEVKAKCNLHGVWSTIVDKKSIKDIEIDSYSQ